MNDTLVIVNPAAAGGRTGRSWPDVAARLRAAGLDHDAALTSSAGEATKLARQAALDGRATVVAAGGDGTINEVANGLLAAGQRGAHASAGPRLGVLPAGTGGDFRRTFGIPRDVEAAAAVLGAGHVRRIDAGRVTCAVPGGGVTTRHFVNIASAGIGGDVVDRVARGPHVVNGEVTFALASILTLLRWKNRPVHVEVDGRERDLVAQQVVVANCQYFGGGMRVAPRAAPDDGLLDVVIAGDLGTWENVRGLSRIREGTHLDAGSPKITHELGRRVEVSSPELVRVEADGEQPGVLPAVFEVVPSALELLCP